MPFFRCLPYPPAGLGDTAASVVGRLCGRHPICPGSPKTYEGTLGGLTATLLGWAALGWLGGSGLGGAQHTPAALLGLLAATAMSSLLEALTTQLDNLFVPLHYCALLCCAAAQRHGSAA